MKTSPSQNIRVSAAVLGLSLLLAIPGLTGCIAVAAGAGAGAVAYVTGELESNLPNDYSRVVDATRQAIGDLEFVKVSENKDGNAAKFVARTALDKKIVINLVNTGKKLTNIKIRVDLLGDQQLSMAVLDKIKAGL